MITRVKNMTSAKGNKVANQFIINTNDEDGTREEIFQSYKSTIVKAITYYYGAKKIILDEYFWDYSVTTGRYRNEFLGEGIAETRKKIESGEYILEDLNSFHKEDV
tara:strand:+ start:59 stop:376 length:318 start_codon:yes stop_codon:yes gene_type:complete